MSGIIFTVIAFVIGIAICGAGLYYLTKEKQDPESRTIYSITAGAGAIIAIGTVVKVLMIGL